MNNAIEKMQAGILLEYPPFKKDFLENLSRNDLFPGRLIIVLDDDPTGIQTVHDVSVYTTLDKETIFEAFENEEHMFFILTNSRSMSASETRKLHANFADWIDEAACRFGKDYIIASRSDSTLRGHWPLETETLRNRIESKGTRKFDGEIICPFFKEGGRYTLNNIHYVLEGDTLIPASLTEFAKDKTFPYSSSYLPEWCFEKSEGKCSSEDIICISIEELRGGNLNVVEEKLKSVESYNKIIVNAISYEDLMVFSSALSNAISYGKEYMIRSAASLIKVMGCVQERPFLRRDELIDIGNKNGGLVVIGSHVDKTTKQLATLSNSCLPCVYIEFNQESVLDESAVKKEIASAAEAANCAISSGKTAVIYTRRKRLDLDTDEQEKQLKLSTAISDALTETVKQIKYRPSFIVAKGGITSSDIGTKALDVKKATVAGQIRPGIPVWNTGSSSRFPKLPFIIFPGNVGSEDDLKYIVKLLTYENV